MAVPAVTVDALVQSMGLDRVDLIKSDVEGLDGAVLEGAARTLARWRPRLVFEHDRGAWAAAGYELERTIRMLESAGYRHFAALGGRGLVRFDPAEPAGKNVVASAEPLGWAPAG